MLIQTLHEKELEAIANLPTPKIHGNFQRLLLYGTKMTSEVCCREKARQQKASDQQHGINSKRRSSNSLALNPVDYNVLGAILQKYRVWRPKRKNQGTKDGTPSHLG